MSNVVSYYENRDVVPSRWKAKQMRVAMVCCPLGKGEVEILVLLLAGELHKDIRGFK